MSVVVCMLYGTILLIGSLICGFQTALSGAVAYLLAKFFLGNYSYGINPYFKVIPQLAFTVVFAVFLGFVITLVSDAGLGDVLVINQNGFFAISLLMLCPDFYQFKDQYESIKRANQYINSATDANFMNCIQTQYSRKSKA